MCWGKTRVRRVSLRIYGRGLTHRYENRPSREEDVSRMRAMEADAVERENLVARTLEEMAFVKRELLNREENYNKKFNANPVVGVMQVHRTRDAAIFRLRL